LKVEAGTISPGFYLSLHMTDGGVARLGLAEKEISPGWNGLDEKFFQSLYLIAASNLE
jgi:hypothetical protein